MSGFSKVKWVKQTMGNAVIWSKPGQSVTGLYMGSRPTEYDGRKVLIHVIKPEKGDALDVWESTVLKKLRGLKKGTPVRIVFTGNRKGKGKRKYKNFDVFLPEGVVIKG